MQCPPEQHKHVHAEVVDLKDLGLGKEEHKDTDELGDGDAADHRLPHVGQCGVSTLHAGGQGTRAEPAHNVRAELNCNTNSLQRRGGKSKLKSLFSTNYWLWLSYYTKSNFLF